VRCEGRRETAGDRNQRGDIEQEIERIGAVVFVKINITIVNTGGKAHGIKFKVRSQITVDIKFNARLTLLYNGIGGTREVPLPRSWCSCRWWFYRGRRRLAARR
jgi:hypothetical protein